MKPIVLVAVVSCLVIDAGAAETRASAATPTATTSRVGSAPPVATTPHTDATTELERLRALVDGGQWGRARQGLSALIERTRIAGDRQTEGEAHGLLGSCLQSMGFNALAASSHRSALALAREIADEDLALRAQAGIAMALAQDGRGDRVVDTLRALVGTARSRHDDELAARAWLAIALHEMNRVDPARALASYDSARMHARRAGASRLEAGILLNSGSAFDRCGEPDSALARLETARRLAGEIGAHGETVAALVRLGLLHSKCERFSLAIATLREALRQAAPLGFPRAVANAHSSLGMLHARLGENDEALVEFNDAARLARQMQNARFEAGMQRWIASVLAAQGQFEAADASLAAALRLEQSNPHPYQHIWLLADRAGLHMRRGNFAAAQSDMNEAIELAREAGEHATLVELAGIRSHLHNEHGEHGLALAWADSSLALAGVTGREAQRRDAWFEKGRALRALGDLRAADRAFAAAIASAEGVRTRLGGEELRIAFQQQVHELYFQRARTLCALARDLESEPGADSLVAEAYHVAERAHGRALLELLGGGSLPPGSGTPPVLRDRRGALQRQLERAQASLSWNVAQERASPSRIDSLRRDLAAVRRELRATEVEISARSPIDGDLAGIRPPLRAAEVRERVLQPDQVLVEYLVGAAETLVFAIGPHGLRARTIPLGADSLRALVESFRAAIIADSPLLPTLAARLHGLLLAPVRDELAAHSHLLVVTDGPLVTLPFAALRSDDHYLVETHAIATAPSASVLDPALRPKRRGRSPVLLAVGNPTTHRARALLDETRAATAFRFGPLPYAEEEVHQVARHFRRARTLVGALATEDAIASALPRATVVHFATHAWFDAREPLSSGLVLAQDEDPDEDGFLQAREILDLELDAELVVLSACDTGLGKQAAGEGLIGLARAFLQTGARQLVVSLWEVADRGAIGLMDRFHAERMGSRVPTDLGLQRAQLDMLRAGAPVRDWAAFVVLGLPTPPESAAHPLWLIPVLVVVVVGMLLLAERRRRAGHARASTPPGG